MRINGFVSIATAVPQNSKFAEQNLETKRADAFAGHGDGIAGCQRRIGRGLLGVEGEAFGQIDVERERKVGIGGCH